MLEVMGRLGVGRGEKGENIENTYTGVGGGIRVAERSNEDAHRQLGGARWNSKLGGGAATMDGEVGRKWEGRLGM